MMRTRVRTERIESTQERAVEATVEGSRAQELTAGPGRGTDGHEIKVESVSKSFGRDSYALEAVDLTIEDGEFVSILGPSGCGKSTLMLIAAGLEGASEGRVSVGGDEVTKPITDVGIVFQDDLLLEFRSALDNVALQCEIRGMSKSDAREKARQMLDTMGLDKARDRYPRQMSGGMRQRVAIARALIHEPSVLLMDEPFGALDAITRTRMQGELERLWMSGEQKTVMFITHAVEEAVRLSDRVIVLSPSPGRVAGEFRVTAPRPRPIVIEDNADLVACYREIYELFYKLGVFDD